MSEKTEKPTPKKITDARKKGQVAKSQDLIKLLITASILEVLVAMVDTGMGQLKTLVSIPLNLFNQPFGYAIEAVVVQCATIMVSLTAISLGIAVVMLFVASWGQFGFLVAVEAMKIDFNKLNPMTQIKNMFSGRSLFELFNNLLKASTIALILYLNFEPCMALLVKIPLTDLDAGWRLICLLFIKIERILLAVLIVLVAFDYGMQKFFHIKSLKMSKDDVKQEYKNMEGDPHMKGHRKSLARELVEGDDPAPVKRAEEDLSEADVLVVNPTHYAVALHYRPGKTPLPMILTKGHDDRALQLIDEAKEKNIPIVKFIWLARTLHKKEEGHYIPRNTLRYVAKIYQTLRELDDDIQHDEVLEIEGIESV